MADQDELPFLSRWSRRKLEAKDSEPPAAPVVAPVPAALPVTEPNAAEPAASLPPAAAPAELPSLDSLQGVASEYRDFLKPGVDETLKRAALKKLFNDPHFGFANMDKLDIYVDDYSIEDPIPEALLRSLNQSKNLFLFETKEEETERKALASGGTPDAGASRPAALEQSADPDVQPATDAAQPAASELDPAVPPKPV